MKSMKINFLDFSHDDLTKYFINLDEKPFHALQLIKWIHQKGVLDFAQMTNLGLNLRNFLSENCVVIPPEIIKEQQSFDGTCKWLFQMQDDNLIETVLIPDGNRATLCISCQVGCPLACGFCATGACGFTRDLTVSEIIGQLWTVIHIKKINITNIVFMGMGEPLLNYDNVLKATSIMLNDNTYGLSKYKVTISTCGLIPQIIKLKEQSEVALAVSLHAPTDELRSKIMPINKKYPLSELIKICDDYYKDKKRMVTIEYIMLSGLNDSQEQAKQLIKLLSHGRYKVNLIPSNVVTHTDIYKPSSQQAINKFRDILLQAGIMTITRKSRGNDIAAACGQLCK